jgi:hypothetical protein
VAVQIGDGLLGGFYIVFQFVVIVSHGLIDIPGWVTALRYRLKLEEAKGGEEAA